jgi:glucan 1,4-alpha-glucosidase
VWFTVADAAMTEVYYPRVDVANVRDLQLVVTDGRTFSDREGDATTSRVRLLRGDSLRYRQVNTDRDGRYRIVKTYTTDPARASVVVDVRVVSLDGGRYTSYVLYDPSLANSGLHDSGRTVAGATLVASDTSADTPVASALAARPAFRATSSGYAGTSDGWTDLRDDHTLDWSYDDAPDGNLVQVGQLAAMRHGQTRALVSLGFGRAPSGAVGNARGSLRAGFSRLARAYDSGWASYLRSIRRPPASVRRDKSLATQYNVAAMTLRAHEDKTFRGANIASLTIPWGEAVNADNPGVGGYHLVWARDLYQVATAQLAAGDRGAANRSLDYLFDVQQKPDGSFPQNSLLDGTPYWGSLQLDEVAFPIVLAGQLGRYDAGTWSHVKRAADFLVGHGPATPQERWEEEGGYSPSSIAAEVAGLVTAARVARRNGDHASAVLYTAVADDWQRRVKGWTVTTTGPLGDGHYFERIDDNGDPDDGHMLEINNGGGTWDERTVVDAGFLDLVRLGVLPADDPEVTGSLPEVDSTIRVRTPSGAMWYRYNHDGYGEKADGSPYDGTGVGRLWPLLSGERGEYALASGRPATSYLQTMARTANEGFMIPEQVWDRPDAFGLTFGEGTGSATPLAWSMAQFVRLARSIDAGRPVEQPRWVARRYASGHPPTGPSVVVSSPEDGYRTDAGTVTVTGRTDGVAAYVNAAGQTTELDLAADGSFSAELPLVLGRNTISLAVVGADGGTTLVQRHVVSTNLGEPVGAVTDPPGDDNGPGSYVYPANDAFVPGAFDITRLGVYADAENVNVAVTIAGNVTNPWGGNQISVQRFDVYLAGGSGGVTPALPGTNADLTSPYSFVVTADGFSGLGVKDAAGTTVGSATLTAIPESHQIVVSVPRSVLDGVDLSSTRYAVTMLSHADASEGAGGIRPVYDLGYWQSTAGTDMSWIHDYRFGGGAGEYDGSTAAKDTDTSDPNTLDIVVPSGQDQSEVLDWTAQSPVVLPYVDLAAG